jgi:hypothetical protein
MCRTTTCSAERRKECAECGTDPRPSSHLPVVQTHTDPKPYKPLALAIVPDYANQKCTVENLSDDFFNNVAKPQSRLAPTTRSM